MEIAENLAEKGYDAVSLTGGYLAWLCHHMEEEQKQKINEDVEQSIRKKFHKKIWSKFTKAINQYQLVKEGDSIAVCISGGKDSMLMAKLFQELKRHSKFSFDVKFLVMDPGYNAVNRKVIEDNAKKLNIPIQIFESDIFESVYHVEKSPCYLCARMRRGHLYSYAKELGCNKIALGHHYDDVIETILMPQMETAHSKMILLRTIAVTLRLQEVPFKSMHTEMELIPTEPSMSTVEKLMCREQKMMATEPWTMPERQRLPEEPLWQRE